MKKILPIALVVLLCAHQSFAASFDCAKAATRTEVDVESKGFECGMRSYFGGTYHKKR